MGIAICDASPPNPAICICGTIAPWATGAALKLIAEAGELVIDTLDPLIDVLPVDDILNQLRHQPNYG